LNVLSSRTHLAVMTLLLAVPGCGMVEATTPGAYAPVEYAPIDAVEPVPIAEEWPVHCSFANRTQNACIGSCLRGDATSCNDAGRLLELHATGAKGLTEAHEYFARACVIGHPKACKNAVRVEKRRAAALRRVTPAPAGDGVSL
jgi:hypothetical protein